MCVISAQEMIGLYPERVISIRGTVDNMVKAEAAIYCKLVECAEQDMKSPVLVCCSLPFVFSPSGEQALSQK